MAVELPPPVVVLDEEELVAPVMLTETELAFELSPIERVMDFVAVEAPEE